MNRLDLVIRADLMKGRLSISCTEIDAAVDIVDDLVAFFRRCRSTGIGAAFSSDAAFPWEAMRSAPDVQG